MMFEFDILSGIKPADCDPDNPNSEEREYYFKSLKEIVLPNIQKLQKSFRDHKLEVIHIRIQSLTKDGRDRSPGHKKSASQHSFAYL